MIVKKKAKEQTEFEKRNTAIVIFVLIALVPLLLSFFLGMNMCEAKDRNTEKLLVVLDSLRNENAGLTTSIKDLAELVNEVDSFQFAFDEAALKLEIKLSDIREDPDQELVPRWSREKRKVINIYNKKIDNLAGRSNKIKNKKLIGIKKINISWIERKIQAKEEQFRTLEKKKELSLSASIAGDQKQIIQDLEGKVLLKETMILNLEAALGRSKGSASNQLNSAEEDKEECKDELEALTETMKTAKGKIEKKIEEIQNDILPKLKVKRVLNMREIREDLEKKLTKIERYVDDLK